MSGKKEIATIKAIADEAGVTTTTVSCILNNTGGKYAEKTCEKILAIAERLHYRPNTLAAGIRTGRTHIAGVMVPNRRSFYNGIVNGIHDALLQRDTLMLLCWNDYYIGKKPNIREERRIIHHLVDHRVDGIILRPASEAHEHSYFEEIWERGIPLILVDRHLSKIQTDFVGTDDEAGGKVAAEHLVSLGHRNLLYVGAEDVSVSRDRESGFLGVIRQTPSAMGSSQDFADNDAREQLRRLFRQKTCRPTGVFCINDSVAVDVMTLALEAGLTVPGNLSIIGFGNQYRDVDLAVTLTTFDQHPSQIGAAAAQLYLDRVDGEAGDEFRSERIKPDLVVRESTRKWEE